MRDGLSHFVCSQIGRLACEPIVDIGQPHARVYRRRSGAKLKIEIGGLI